MILAGLLMATYLYVSPAVASLQFDLDTAGAIQLDPSVHKSIATSQVSGKTRVIIYALDQAEFVGKFASVSAPVSSITNIVGAKGNGDNANASVNKLSNVQGLRITVKK
jgi:hypothetical protein